MTSSFRRGLFFLFLSLAISANSEGVELHAHGMVPADGMASAARPGSVPAHLLYYGGPVLSHVKVVAVFWGPNVDSEIKANIGNLYAGLSGGEYMDWLQEYNTRIDAIGARRGTNQDIGRGGFVGAFTINPKNTRTRLDQKEAAAEIERQIDAGVLPRPDADTLYMVHFPPGIILRAGGTASCYQWCGDHESFKSQQYGNIVFALLPDFGGTCRCHIASNIFDSLTITASHEFTESVTDPLPTGTIWNAAAFPSAWITGDEYEIGDLCLGTQAVLQTSARAFIVQGEWDNAASSCKTGTFSAP